MNSTRLISRPPPESLGFVATAFEIIACSGYGHHLSDIKHHLNDLREMQDAYEQRVSELFILRANLIRHGFNLVTEAFPEDCVITEHMGDLLHSMTQLRQRMRMNIAYMVFVDKYYKKLLLMLLDTPELWGQEGQDGQGGQGCVIA